MEAEMKSAWIKAGIKFGIGAALIVSVVGIRVISVAPDGVDAGIEELERLESELARETTPAEGTSGDPPEGASAGDGDAASVASGASRGSRAGAAVFERMPGSDSKPDASDADRMVSCQIARSTRFMSAADCATRGGRSTDL